MALLALMGLAAAQAPPIAPKPGDKDYTAEVTVRVGEVQILATDSDNHPLLGLRPDEIDLREGGQRRRIAYVEPFATRDLVVRLLPKPSPLVTARGERTEQVPEAAAFPAPKPQRRIVLLFDAYNSRTQDRERWVKGARGWVEKTMRDDDLVAVAVLEKGTIRFLQNFSTDKSVLLQLFSTGGFMPPGDYHDYSSDITEINNNMMTCDNAHDQVGCVMNAATPVINDWSNRTRLTLGALRQLAATLASIPGRKAVLFISNGVIVDPGKMAGNTILAKLGPDRMSYSYVQSMFETRLEGEMLELGRVASASAVSFFTFDTRSSSRRDMGGDVDQREITSFIGNTDPYAQIFDVTRGSLDTMAIETGGRSMHGPRIELNLPTASGAIEGLYTIGFYRDTYSEPRAKLKIKIARKGADVTFVDRFDPTRRTPQVVHLEIGIGKPRPFEREIEIPVLVQVPIDELSLAKTDEDKWQAEVGLYAEAVTPDGVRAASVFETALASLDATRYEHRVGLKFVQSLALRVPPGAYRIRVRASDSKFQHAAERAVDITVRPDFTLVPGIQDSVQDQKSGRLTDSDSTIRPTIPSAK